MGRFFDYLKGVWDENMKYYDRNQVRSEREAVTTEESRATKKRIAILINSRVDEEILSKDEYLKFCALIEEEMQCFPCLPFQICNCSYIGEHMAWASYNMTNQRCLQLAINELNYLLADLNKLDKVVSKVITGRYYIDFKSICFDYSDRMRIGDLPRSYMLYKPRTKSMKISRYPLVAYFNTVKNAPDEKPENYCGELYYSANGELCEAKLHYLKKGSFVEFEFSVIGRTFMISKIRTTGSDGKLFLLYDCKWKFTDYIDFT